MKKQEEYLERYWSQLLKAGEQLRNQEMPQLREEDFFLFKKTGNRLIYEGEYFGRRKYLTVFGILSEFGRDKADISKLEEVITDICKERFWALPAHVNFEQLDENTIDLFAAETAQTLAEMLMLFSSDFKQETVETVVLQIIERVLKPFSTSKIPYSWWETDRCNWSAVCAGSIGMAAIYINEMSHQKSDIIDWNKFLELLPADWYKQSIDRVCKSMQCYLNGMEDDGACTEGLGYFSYGMSYYTAFAELLYEATNGKTNLMDYPKCEKIALFQQKCYFGKGISLSFSDGDIHDSFQPGLTAYLAHCYHSVKIPDFRLARDLESDACYRWLANERNIRWLKKYPIKIDEEINIEKSVIFKAHLLPSAQWMICKDINGNGYAAKGGNNAENHNHNDVGAFLCSYEGEMLLADLGAGEYTKDYFNEGRYNILCNRSLGHCVPLINDMEQCAGKEYCSDSFEWNEENKELMISFSNAYPKGLIEEIRRTITMSQEHYPQMQIDIKDSFKKSQITEKITENLVSFYKPVIMDKINCDDNAVNENIKSDCTNSSEQHDKNQYIIYIEGLESACEITVRGNIAQKPRIISKPHFTHDGKKITVYLIQWDIMLTKEAFETNFMCITFHKK